MEIEEGQYTRSEDVAKEVRKHFIHYDHIATVGCTSVWKVRERDTYEVVYLKKQFRLFMDDVNSKRVYREIFYLHSLRDHPNFLRLLHVMPEPNRLDLYMVYPYMHLDLGRADLDPNHIEYVTKQMLLALTYLHSAGLRHGSIQPCNVLLTSACEVRLSDFARCRPVGDWYSTAVDDCPDWKKAAWYYPPEITINSARRASAAEDIWAMGVTLGEVMAGGQALFPGTSTLNQIARILETIDAPTEAEMQQMANPRSVMMVESVLPPLMNTPLQDLLGFQVSAPAVDFVAHCLKFSPGARSSAQELLKHPYLLDLKHPDPEEEAALIKLYPPGGLQLPDKARGKKLAPHEYRELINELAAEVAADRQRKCLEDFNVLHPTLEP